MTPEQQKQRSKDASEELRAWTASQREAGDAVDHPAHYTGGTVECIDALEAATEGLVGIEAVCTANAIKYLWRWRRKGGAEDLRKARWYIDWLLARSKGGQP